MWARLPSSCSAAKNGRHPVLRWQWQLQQSRPQHAEKRGRASQMEEESSAGWDGRCATRILFRKNEHHIYVIKKRGTAMAKTASKKGAAGVSAVNASISRSQIVSRGKERRTVVTLAWLPVLPKRHRPSVPAWKRDYFYSAAS
mmetsp:Transcript_79183/g.164313  ORF Transcript_79183/g.164313 Transcript_79183/m.164313 type:complete len:143 (-) Transcript_79183:155-583(-)